MSLYGEKIYGIYDCKRSCHKVGIVRAKALTICNEGMIPGVIKLGRSWAIPADAKKLLIKELSREST